MQNMYLYNIGQVVGDLQSSKHGIKVSGHGFCFQELIFFWETDLRVSNGRALGVPCRGGALPLKEGGCGFGRYKSAMAAGGSLSWLLSGPVGKGRNGKQNSRHSVSQKVQKGDVHC